MAKSMKEMSRLFKDTPARPVEKAAWWIEFVIRNISQFHIIIKHFHNIIEHFHIIIKLFHIIIEHFHIIIKHSYTTPVLTIKNLKIFIKWTFKLSSKSPCHLSNNKNNIVVFSILKVSISYSFLLCFCSIYAKVTLLEKTQLYRQGNIGNILYSRDKIDQTLAGHGLLHYYTIACYPIF